MDTPSASLDSPEALRAELERLQVREKHLQNDLAVTRQESEDSTLHYLETLSALQQRNQELESLKNNLENLVEARTRELRQSQEHLLHMQRVELIGALAGGIAHDFNNILFAIIGYAEMAIEDVPREHPASEKLGAILKACHRAKDLVKHILTFSRQEKSEQRPVLVSPIIQEVVRMLRASVPSSVEIRYGYDRKDLVILGDPTELHQVVMNLGTNAADALRDKGGVLDIRTRRVEPADADLARFPMMRRQPYLHILVQDTGVGIDPAVLPKIFTPFFTTKPPGKGTGLGLAVAQSIAERYGGFIHVESELGKGSAFHVYLPELKGSEAPVPDHDTPVPGGHERILFVDDEPGLVDMARAMLSGLGYEVVALTSSAEALNLFLADPDRFDLALLDHTMPGLSGLDLARMMLRKRPRLPVVLCTGYSDAVTEEQVAAAGLAAFHYKPLVKRELAESIRAALDKAAQPRPQPGA
jgi:signal transduction histidine kinase/ActR/RegA family two-component response regulator